MQEEDPGKLTELFEEYRREYLKDRGAEGERAKRRRAEETTRVQERPSGSGDAAKYEEMEVNKVTEGEVDPWDFLMWRTAKVEQVVTDGGVTATGTDKGELEKRWNESVAGEDPSWEDYGVGE